MEDLSQREIANLLGVSQPTISEWLSLADVQQGTGPRELQALIAFSIAELCKHGMSGPEAASIISGSRSEIEWLLNGSHRHCWLSIYRNGGSQIVSLATSLKQEHLEGVFESRPVGTVVALHVVVARAQERLESLRTRKTGVAA